MRCCQTRHLKKRRIIGKLYLLERLVAILLTIYVTSNLVTATCPTDQMLFRARDLDSKIEAVLGTMDTNIESGTGINGMDEVRNNTLLLASSTLTDEQTLDLHYRSLYIFGKAVLNMNTLAMREPGTSEFRRKLSRLYSALNNLMSTILRCKQISSISAEVSYDLPCDVLCTRQRNFHVMRIMEEYVVALLRNLRT
ncbi:hypothetical protein HOLleu_16743 [Holothuria leucospilota]|uniref:Uncharacterized protein n=1 Tax=Holothuria leucospilota TaxID=206669 RepID=A0A9Q1HBE9_HOLLE|nr:hypothetical protein HOLleu_16743 [Holothuria leucospilota]